MNLTTFNSVIGGMLTPAAEEMSGSYITAVVITGLTVVFLGLVILILFVWAFGKIFNRKKTAPPKNTAPVPPKPAAPAVPPAKPSVASADNDEVIAVIAAAVAAMSEADGKAYRIKSVRTAKNKPARSAWSLAGIQNDTTPF